MSTTNLHKASARFARDDDISYPSLREMFQELNGRDANTKEENLSLDSVEFMQGSGPKDIHIRIEGIKYDMTPYVYSKICRMTNTPSQYIGRMRDTSLAVDCLNHDFNIFREQRKEQAKENNKMDENMLFLTTNNTLRSLTSTSYKRLYDSYVVSRAIEHCTDDIVPGGYVAGGGNSNPKRSGLYLSDRDSFMFLVNQNDPIDIKGEQLHRGIMIWNSEVGSKTIGFQYFMYRYVCANHIIWGAEQVETINKRHVGSLEEVLKNLPIYLEKLHSRTEEDDRFEVLAEKAMNTTFATTEEDYVKRLNSIVRNQSMNNKRASAIYRSAIEDATKTDGDPTTFWGAIQGVTRYSQNIPHSDDRTSVDALSEKIFASIS